MDFYCSSKIVGDIDVFQYRKKYGGGIGCNPTMTKRVNSHFNVLITYEMQKLGELTLEIVFGYGFIRYIAHKFIDRIILMAVIG